MSLDNFIPTVWSGSLLMNLHKQLVYGQPAVVNRNYEGEISSSGDTVKINAIGPVTIGDYVKNVNMADPETLTSAQSILTIDQSKFFNFEIDDIDKAQGKPAVMDAAMGEAGYGLADKADQYIAALYPGVAALNVIGSDGTPVVPTANTAGTSAYEYLVDLGVLLSNANNPKAGRFVVVPPWFHGLLQKDERFVKNVAAVGTDTLINGLVGRAAGFDIYESNNVPFTAGGTKYKIIAGTPNAISFADQITEVIAYRPEKRFADAVKGLHVYGAKLVRPGSIAVMTANPS